MKAKWRKKIAYFRRPAIIGLTGSIAMGKSAVAEMLRAEGVPIFDADAEVHRLQAKGGGLIPVIEAAFPGTTSENGVDRARLGAAVFGDNAALRRLEAIIHPEVAKSRVAFARQYRAHDFVVYDIPLLFEKTGTDKVDLVLLVSAAGWQQRRRTMARAGMSVGKLAQIRKLQLADHLKRKRADHIIDTGQQLNLTRRDVRRFTENLRSALAGM